jgi:uncharacterized protein YaiI (UPF0178 family)
VHIWVDADACPKAVKDILYRAANRLGAAGVALTLVANRMLAVPRSPHIRALQVPPGFDVADREIVGRIGAGDLLVTSDIPLAGEAIAKGARVLTPRGECYDAGNIAAALSLRNFMDSLRSSGVETGGPSTFSASDQHAFARQLDRLLAQRA